MTIIIKGTPLQMLDFLAKGKPFLQEEKQVLIDNCETQSEKSFMQLTLKLIDQTRTDIIMKGEAFGL